MYEVETEDEFEYLASNNKMFDFSNYSTNSKYSDNSKKLVIGKMKDEIGAFAIEDIVVLKPKTFSFLVDHSRYIKAKGMKRNIVTITSHNSYKDALLNNKCIRHSMNRIQSKYHTIGTYEINKISLSYFGDKIYIQNNGYDRLALGYESLLSKMDILIAI